MRANTWATAWASTCAGVGVHRAQVGVPARWPVLAARGRYGTRGDCSRKGTQGYVLRAGAGTCVPRGGTWHPRRQTTGKVRHARVGGWHCAQVGVLRPRAFITRFIGKAGLVRRSRTCGVQGRSGRTRRTRRHAVLVCRHSTYAATRVGVSLTHGGARVSNLRCVVTGVGAHSSQGGVRRRCACVWARLGV